MANTKVDNPYSFNPEQDYIASSNIKSEYDEADYTVVIEVGINGNYAGFSQYSVYFGKLIKNSSGLNIDNIYCSASNPNYLFLNTNNWGKKLAIPQFNYPLTNLGTGMGEQITINNVYNMMKNLNGKRLYCNLIKS